jgi:RNase P/RNase MRP subunit POP5
MHVMVKAGSLRKRYISFELRSPTPWNDPEMLKRSLYAEALRFFGEFGLSQAALKLVEYDSAKKIGVLRCERGMAETVLGFLALADSLDGKPARVVALRTSGTIKGLHLPLTQSK